MRNTFIEFITDYNKKDLYLLVGDLGYSVIEDFQKKKPELFLNIGVAEQNMAGVAAGIASEGNIVFTYSIANFPTFRCAEQIRNDIDYHKYSVITVAVGGGVAYGNLGYSHHAVQDFALMRSLPNMLIASPGDPNEVTACLKYIVENPQPTYLRLNKSGECNVTPPNQKMEPGIWNVIKKPKNGKLLLTTGNTLNIAKNVIDNHLPEWGLATLPLWSQKTKSLQLNQISNYKNVITLEDHLQDGGFGSWLLESCVGYSEINKLKNITLDPEICGSVGDQNFLNEKFGLSQEKIVVIASQF